MPRQVLVKHRGAVYQTLRRRGGRDYIVPNEPTFLDAFAARLKSALKQTEPVYGLTPGTISPVSSALSLKVPRVSTIVVQSVEIDTTPLKLKREVLFFNQPRKLIATLTVSVFLQALLISTPAEQLAVSCITSIPKTNVLSYCFAPYGDRNILATLEGEADQSVVIRAIAGNGSVEGVSRRISLNVTNALAISSARIGDFFGVFVESAIEPAAHSFSLLLFDQSLSIINREPSIGVGIRAIAAGGESGGVLLFESFDDAKPPDPGLNRLKAIRFSKEGRRVDREPSVITSSSLSGLDPSITTGRTTYCISFNRGTPDVIDHGFSISLLPFATNSAPKSLGLYDNGLMPHVTHLGNDLFALFFQKYTNYVAFLSYAMVSTNGFQVGDPVIPLNGNAQILAASSNVVVWYKGGSDSASRLIATSFSDGAARSFEFPVSFSEVNSANLISNDATFDIAFTRDDPTALSLGNFNLSGRDYLCKPEATRSGEQFSFEIYGSAGAHRIEEYSENVWRLATVVSIAETNVVVHLTNIFKQMQLYRSSIVQ